MSQEAKSKKLTLSLKFGALFVLTLFFYFGPHIMSAQAATITAKSGGGNWSSTGTWDSGTVPTSSDDVLLNSGSGSVTIDADASARSLDCTGYTNTLTHASGKTLSIGDSGGGSLKLVTGMTYTLKNAAGGTGNSTTTFIKFVSTTTGNTITTASKSLGPLTFDGVGGAWQLLDSITLSASGSAASISLVNGSLDVNGKNITAGIFTSTAGNIRTLTLGTGSLITLEASNFTVWTLPTGGLTFDAGTSTIEMTNTLATFNGNGLTYNNVTFDGVGNGSSISATNTFANLTINGTANKTDAIAFVNNQTITGTLTIAGNSTTNRVLVRADSGSIGNTRTLTAATVTVSNADFQDITGAGAGSWDLSGITGGSGDAGGNSGITFTTAAHRYWVATSGGNWSATSSWSASPGGASGASVPLPQDAVTFDGSSISSTGKTITNDMPRIGKDIDFGGVTNNPLWSISSSGAIWYGSLTLGSGMTTSGVNGITVQGRGGVNITSNNVAIVPPFAINAPGGTVTLQDDFNNTGNTFTITSGTFNANNHAVTFKKLTGNGTRTWTMGSGTWQATGTGTVVDATGGTLTVNPNNSKFQITDTTTSDTFAGNGKTYYDLEFDPGGGNTLTLTGNNSFNSITVGASNTISFGSTTTTFTGSGTPFALSGTFTPSTSTVKYTSTSATNIAATTYNALSLSPAGTVTYTLGTGASQTIIVNSTFTVGNGTNAVTVDASANNPTLNFLAGVTINANAIWTKGTTTVVFKAGGSQTWTDSTSGQDLGAVQVSVNSTNTTVNLSGTASATTLTIDASQTVSLNGSNTLILTGTVTPFTNNGTFTYSTGTFRYTGNGATITCLSGTGGTNGYYNLDLKPSSSLQQVLCTGSSQTLAVNNTLTIGNGTNTGATAATNNPTINLLGNLTIAANATYTKGSGTTTFEKGGAQTLTDNTSGQDLGAVQVSVNSTNTTLNLGSGAKATSLTIDASQTFSANGSNTLALTGTGTPFTVNGTFTRSTGTVQYTGTSATVTATTFNGLTLGGTGTYTMPATTTNITGNLIITSGATVTKGAGTVVFEAGATQTWTDNTSGQDLGAAEVSVNSTNTTVNLGSSVKATSLTIDASQTVSLNGSNTLALTGTGTPLSTSGTFTPSTGTVQFTGTSATINGITFYNLTLGGSGTYTLPSGTLTIQGNFTNNGTVVHNSGTVVFSGSAISTISSASSMSFYNITSITGSKVIQFQKQSSSLPVFTIAGMLTLTGTNGGDIVLQSDTSGTQWLLTLSGSASVSYLAVKDSGCSSSNTVTANATVTNVGNNGTCWSFLNLYPPPALNASGGGTLLGGGGFGGGGTAVESGGGGQSGGGTPATGGGQGGGGGAVN